MDEAGFCTVCGGVGHADGGVHEDCLAEATLDPPRFCGRCGRRLDVQVFPTSYRATCRRCDGIHPAAASVGT